MQQADAAERSYEGLVVATDPPYYDNIGYSDLSDFFYVWLRRSLRCHIARLRSHTCWCRRSEELVANPYRHGGKEGAKEFFEAGFRSRICARRETANVDFPMTVCYAFKQSEFDRRW